MFTEKNTKNKNNDVQEKILLLEDPIIAELHDIRNKMAPNNKDSNLIHEIGLEKARMAVEETIKKYSKEGKKVFTTKELEEECANYGLWFEKSELYRGELSLELIAKVKKFIEENNLIVSPDEYRTNMVVLGKASFTDEKRYTSYKSEVRDFIKISDGEKDPIIFYKLLDKGEKYYILLNEDKTYKTVWNRIRGYSHYNRSNSRAIIFCILTILIGSFASLWLNAFYSLLISIPLSLVGSFIFNTIPHGDVESNNHYTITYENAFAFEEKTFGRNSIILIGIFILLSYFINYEINSVKYTLNNKLVYDTEDSELSYQEAKKVVAVKPNVCYYVRTTSNLEYVGHWWYYTINELNKKQTIIEKAN
jgi:hypothetical protein